MVTTRSDAGLLAGYCEVIHEQRKKRNNGSGRGTCLRRSAQEATNH